MPVKITKLKSGLYRVSTDNGVRAKGTTEAKAHKQKRILDQFEERKRRAEKSLAPLRYKR